MCARARAPIQLFHSSRIFLLSNRIPAEAIPRADGRSLPAGRPGRVLRRSAIAGQRSVRLPAEFGKRLSGDEDGGQCHNFRQPIRYFIQLRPGARPSDATLSDGRGRLRLPLGRHPQSKETFDSISHPRRICTPANEIGPAQTR